MVKFITVLVVFVASLAAAQSVTCTTPADCPRGEVCGDNGTCQKICDEIGKCHRPPPLPPAAKCTPNDMTCHDQCAERKYPSREWCCGTHGPGVFGKDKKGEALKCGGHQSHRRPRPPTKAEKFQKETKERLDKLDKEVKKSPPKGTDGKPGEDGKPGPPGTPCWDKNQNGKPDADEDVNGDGKFDVEDCQGKSPDLRVGVQVEVSYFQRDITPRLINTEASLTLEHRSFVARVGGGFQAGNDITPSVKDRWGAVIRAALGGSPHRSVELTLEAAWAQRAYNATAGWQVREINYGARIAFFPGAIKDETVLGKVFEVHCEVLGSYSYGRGQLFDQGHNGFAFACGLGFRIPTSFR